MLTLPPLYNTAVDRISTSGPAFRNGSTELGEHAREQIDAQQALETTARRHPCHARTRAALDRHPCVYLLVARIQLCGIQALPSSLLNPSIPENPSKP